MKKKRRHSTAALQEKAQLLQPQMQEWDLEAELQALLERKLEAEKNLAVIESKIYALETSYLNEIKDPGSVVRGYAKLLPPSQTPTPPNELDIPMQTDAMDISMDHLKVVEEDAVEDLDPYRIFSSSSFTTDASRAMASRISTASNSVVSSKTVSRANSPITFGMPYPRRRHSSQPASVLSPRSPLAGPSSSVSSEMKKARKKGNK